MKKNFKMVLISLTFLIIGGVLAACGKVKEKKSVETTTETTTEITFEEINATQKEKVHYDSTINYKYKDYSFDIPNCLSIEDRDNGFICKNEEYSLIVKVFEEHTYQLTEQYLRNFIKSIDQFKNADEIFFESTTLNDKSVCCLWTGTDNISIFNCAIKSKPSGDEYIVIISMQDITSKYDYTDVFGDIFTKLVNN